MPSPKNKTRKIIIFSLIGITIIALATIAAVRKREVLIEVETEKVARRDLTEIVVANGRIQPVMQVVINPEVSGEIIDLPVKEGQLVKKGDLLLKIKPDNYIAQRNSVQASYLSTVAGRDLAKANLDKAELELARAKQLYANKVFSDSDFLSAKTDYDVKKASYETSTHQVDQAKASLARAEDDLSKTTIVAPIDGTVTKLKSQTGERVVGTAMMAGTEVMTIANLDDMEARVDIGESDVVLIALGQRARLEVEAFRNRKFSGVVSEIANASKNSGGSGQQMNNSAQEATRFEVKIRINEKELFRPGMTVTAEIETRSVTNAVAVPIQCVTTRITDEDRERQEKARKQAALAKDPDARQKKEEEALRVPEIVFIVEGDKVKKVKVTTGISDDTHIEIKEGLNEGQEVVSGGYKAISRELDEGKKIRREDPAEKKRKRDKEKKKQE